MEQIMEILVRMEADRKAWREKAEMDHKKFLARLRTDEKAWREEIRSVLFETTNTREEMMAYRELMEARPEVEKPTSADRKPEAAEEYEDPVEDAEVVPVGEPRKKRRRERNQRSKKKRTQGNDGYQRRLAAAHRGTNRRVEVSRKMQAEKKMPRRATVARRMRDIFRPNTTRRATVARQIKEKDRKVPGRPRITWRKRIVVRRNCTMTVIELATQRVGPLKNNLRTQHKGTKDPGGKRPLHGRKKRTTTDGIRKWNPGERALLGSEGTLRKILYEIYGPKNTKRMPKATSRTRRIADWTLWKGRPPPKRKK
jgi:hypothetical protein